MNIPCPTRTTCPCDNLPGTAYSSEAPDAAQFVSTQFAQVIPPLGDSTWARLVCQMTAFNPLSQQAADQAALQLAVECANGEISAYAPDQTPGGSGDLTPETFVNAEQSCTVSCPDGTTFTYTVQPGQFTGASQAAADSAAFTYACEQANARLVCLSAITPSNPLLNVAYTGTITASGGQTANNLNTWALISGSMPPGLTLNLNSSQTATITGTPTMAGTYPFIIQITDSAGNTNQKQFSLTVSCNITAQVTANSANLTPTTPDSPYDTKYANANMPAGPLVGFNASFNSPTAQNWNYKVRFGKTGGNPDIFPGGTLTINGKNINFTGPFGNMTATGSFQTNGCSPVVLAFTFDYLPSGGGQGFASVEWQTP